MSTPILPRVPPETAITREALRTPRAAGAAGVVFGILMITALVLIRAALPASPHEAGIWLSDGSHRKEILFALSLVPFAGVAFLWFIGVVRDRIGEAEDRLFATVFLGSGLLFVGMIFVSAAIAADLVASIDQNGSGLATTQYWAFGRRVTYTLTTIYAMRMAAIFTISTSTILLRSRLLPRWLGLSGYAIAIVLLLTVGFIAWFELLFPVWVLVLSIYILVDARRLDRSRAALQASTPGS
jgi:hypothetical protein